VVIVNFIIKSFIYRVREKFGKFDLKRQCHLGEASSALPFGYNIHGSTDQNAIVKHLKTHLHVHVSTGHDGDEAFAETIGNVDFERQFAVLTGAMHQVKNGDLVDGVDKFNHSSSVRSENERH